MFPFIPLEGKRFSFKNPPFLPHPFSLSLSAPIWSSPSLQEPKRRKPLLSLPQNSHSHLLPGCRSTESATCQTWDRISVPWVERDLNPLSLGTGGGEEGWRGGMANADTSASYAAAGFPFGGTGHPEGIMRKRKTPSQLGEEQLKRRSFEIPSSSQMVSLLPSDRLSSKAINGFKNPETLKNPKYIDTRVNEHFPVKKSGNNPWLLYGQEKPTKGCFTINKTINLDSSSHLHKPSAAGIYDEKCKSDYICDKVEESESVEGSASVTARTSNEQVFRKVNTCSQNTFRSVAELSLGSKNLYGFPKVDMEKALKGLVSCESSAPSGSASDSLGSSSDHSNSSRNFSSEFYIPGNKSPLDFTLKTTFQLVSSSSVRWCHRLFSSGSSDATTEFSSCCGCTNQNTSYDLGLGTTADALLHKALRSWSYPQSFLPSSIISTLSLSTSRAEMEFLKKRHQDWEDAFRNLYYMLRKNKCGIFYVYTSQFIALFISSNFPGKKANSCNAYLSQSTHGLRSLLVEHDIRFSMPLYHSHPEQAAPDDLVEFLEIEKCNLGQALHLNSLSDVDNSPQSLLAFLGNRNVHALYEFLLNYRFFLSSLTSSDVPMLLGPVAFRNGSMFTPEVKCKEMKRADAGWDLDGTKEIPNSLPTSICYSIEVKDDILPPWIISRTCAAMGFQGMFESRFTTDPKSLGLNAALDSILAKSDARPVSDGDLNEGSNNFHVPQTIITPKLRSTYLSALKYSNGSYTAFTTPV